MASTKSAAFSSKIRNLNEYYNNIVNCSLPVANTGADITSTLKYFSQTLQTLLKEISQEEIDVVDLESSNATTAADHHHHHHHHQNQHHHPQPNEEVNLLSMGLVESTNTLGTIVNQTVSHLAKTTTTTTTTTALGDDDKLIYTATNRTRKFPNLNYSTLYHSLINIIEIIPTIQTGQISVGQSLLHTFGCLAPFLAEDLIDSLPYTIALTLTSFPRDLHKYIMDILCNTLMPIAIYSNQNEDSFLINSLPSIIMIVLQFGCDTAFHAQLFECLLSLRRNLIQDIVCSIAYGSYKVRYHATNLLFHYWPRLNPNRSDRNIHYHFNGRKTVQCQSERCVERKNIANKVCIDPNYCMHGANTPPPYYVCSECYREIPKKFQTYCHNIVQPVEDLSIYCENRNNCKASDKTAYVTCYSSPCITLNQNKPITFCRDCHASKHQRLQNKSDHVFQFYIDNIWNCNMKMKLFLSTSIINLLKEVPVIESKKNVEFMEHSKRTNATIMHQQTVATAAAAATSNAPSAMHQSNVAVSGGVGGGGGGASAQTAVSGGGGGPNPSTSTTTTAANALNSSLAPVMATTKGADLTSLISVGLIGALNTNGCSNTSALASTLFASGSSSEESNFNKRLLSRFGCYLIITLVKPDETSHLELFGRIISMVLEWFHLVCYIPSDASGELISKVRSNFILPWIKTVTENHFELVVSCLVPFPPEFAKVGGIWETKANRSSQIKEEFVKYCDLIPYEIVTFEIWDYSMPFWLESIINEVNDKHLVEFRNIFVKLFDPEMVLFKPELMYRFVIERFEGTSSAIQEQALSWLQILCELDVNIPMNILVGMFHTGLNSLQKLESRAMRRREAYASISDVELAQYNQNVLNNNPFTVFDTYEAFRVYRNQLMLQQMTGQELAMLIKEEEEDFIINSSELNINCCIMMLDMVLKQFNIQKSTHHLGIFNGLSKELLLLMSKQLILPWAKKHKCKQQFGFLSAENTTTTTTSSSLASSTSTNVGAATSIIPISTTNISSNSFCQFCEEYVLWFTFAKDILIYISPKQEIDLPEINFNHLLDTYSSGISLQGQTNAAAAAQNEMNNDEKPKKAESKTDPDVGVWVTSDGVYYFKFIHLSPHLQLLYSMLKELYRVPDVDAFCNLMVCLKMLIIHCDCLELANKEQKGFLIYSLEKMLVPSLWKLFSADYCHLNDVAVPLLVHSLLYESGRNSFWSLIDRDFKDQNWKVRMQAVSRCISIAQHIKPKQIKANCNIFSSLSLAFSYLIFSINDIEPIVSQKVVTLLETLSDQAIKSIITCFELQFDCVIIDRPFILRVLSKFYTCLLSTSANQQTILTWEFFMQRFNTLWIETQLNSNVISIVDISGVSPNNNNFQKKINIAKFSLKRSDFIKSISDDLSLFYSKFSKINIFISPASKLKQNLLKLQKSNIETSQHKTTNANNENEEVKFSTNEIDLNVEKDNKTIDPQTDKKENKNEEKQDEDNISIDLEMQQDNLNKQIMHSLISLLMKFMVNDDQSVINEDRIMTKQQNVVLKHIYSLIKYNTNDQLFSASPSVLRKLTTVNAFLSGLAPILDRNFLLGNNILYPVLRLLRYLPLPSIDENISIRVSQLQAENALPTYTIGLLNSQARHAWISSFLVILYKYQYNNTNSNSNENQNLTIIIKQLLQIVINTLNFQFHKCEITSFDPVKLRVNSFHTRSDNRDCLSQRSTHSTANESSPYNLYMPVQNEDDQSIKSLNEKINSTRRTSHLGNRFFKIKLRSKSNSSTNLTQFGHIAKKNKGFKKGIQVINNNNQIQTTTGGFPKFSKNKDSEYEAVLLETASSDVRFSKACPFNFIRIFNMQKSQNIALKKIHKNKQDKVNQPLSGNIGGMGVVGGMVENFNQLQLSINSYQGLHINKNSQVSRRSAVTKCSIDDENQSLDDDSQYLSNLDLIMNSNEFSDGQFGLSYLKCCKCDLRLEHYSEDAIGGMIVICSTILHRELSLIAPFIIDVIISIMRIASKKIFGWQINSNFYLPGNYTSIAKQFLRCTLHQLVNHKIFYQLFQYNFESADLLEALAISLNDFNELTSVAALKQIINDINTEKSTNLSICVTILNNVAVYIEFLPLESQHSQWTLVIQELETLFRKIEPLMNKLYDYTCLFLIMGNLFKITSISTNKTILEAFSKLLSFILQNCFFKLEHLIEICSLSNRAFTKERDKQYLPRVIVNELVQSISIKTKCTDRNLLLILQFAVLDAGGNIYKSNIIEDENELYDPHYYIPTNAADCLKLHMNEIIAFIGDIHSLSKVKQTLKLEKHLQTCSSEDSLGAQLKAGLSQFLALEFTELNKCKDRDSRSIVKYLPWLSNLPTNAQQGAKEFVECIDHIRFLSWILIGSLTHSALTRNKGTVISYPIPINCGNYIGEHIFYILNGFAEHSKTSAIHMSSLFHSFILCQLWTMYSEQIHVTYDSDNDSSALNSIMEFWNKITPGILQLLSQTKVDNDKYFKELADMVILHFLSLIEGLQEFNSLVLAKFFPMWIQVLFMSPLQGDQLKRAKQCLNYQSPTESQLNTSANYSVLIKCLQRLQYKIAMIEMQSSNAAMLYKAD